MFEKPILDKSHKNNESLSDDLLVGGADSRSSVGQTVGGGALRAIEWSELTAKLNAARELRTIVRRDMRMAIQPVSASFGDAAASYFNSLGNLSEFSEQPVNPITLEGSKPSGGISSARDCEATTGDARKNYD